MRSLFVSILILSFLGCEELNTAWPSGSTVDIYALADYRTEAGSCAIIDSTVILADSIIIPYCGIIYYNSKEYCFTVSNSIHDRLNDCGRYSFQGVPFALCVDQEIIYTGYFWYSFSSMGCNWVIMDPFDFTGENEIRVRLGYPGMIEGTTIPDKRNDRRILNVLRRDGKLME